MAMSSVIKGLDSIEFSCINSRENFDQNKMFYKERLEEEESPKVREILEKDLIHLDRVQIQTASAREFLFILRFRNYNPETNEVQTGISRMTKLLKDAMKSAADFPAKLLVAASPINSSVHPATTE